MVGPSGDGPMGGSELNLVRAQRKFEGVTRRRHEVQEANQGLKQLKKMLGRARERFERNEGRRCKLIGEVKSTHSPNTVNW